LGAKKILFFSNNASQFCIAMEFHNIPTLVRYLYQIGWESQANKLTIMEKFCHQNIIEVSSS